MPFRSEKQRRKLYSLAEQGKFPGGKAALRHWEKETPMKAKLTDSQVPPSTHKLPMLDESGMFVQQEIDTRPTKMESHYQDVASHSGWCVTCDHFNHGRCKALRSSPEVSPTGRCDLWSGTANPMPVTVQGSTNDLVGHDRPQEMPDPEDHGGIPHPEADPSPHPEPDGDEGPRMVVNIGTINILNKGRRKHTLRKGGPYMGPRGGLWADAKHTIPYRKPKQMGFKFDEDKQVPFNFDKKRKPEQMGFDFSGPDKPKKTATEHLSAAGKKAIALVRKLFGDKHTAYAAHHAIMVRKLTRDRAEAARWVLAAGVKPDDPTLKNMEKMAGVKAAESATPKKPKPKPAPAPKKEMRLKPLSEVVTSDKYKKVLASLKETYTRNGKKESFQRTPTKEEQKILDDGQASFFRDYVRLAQKHAAKARKDDPPGEAEAVANWDSMPTDRKRNRKDSTRRNMGIVSLVNALSLGDTVMLHSKPITSHSTPNEPKSFTVVARLKDGSVRMIDADGKPYQLKWHPGVKDSFSRPGKEPEFILKQGFSRWDPEKPPTTGNSSRLTDVQPMTQAAKDRLRKKALDENLIEAPEAPEEPKPQKATAPKPKQKTKGPKLSEPQQRNLDRLAEAGTVIVDRDEGNSKKGFNVTALNSLAKQGLIKKEDISVKRTKRMRDWSVKGAKRFTNVTYTAMRHRYSTLDAPASDEPVTVQEGKPKKGFKIPEPPKEEKPAPPKRKPIDPPTEPAGTPRGDAQRDSQNSEEEFINDRKSRIGNSGEDVFVARHRALEWKGYRQALKSDDAEKLFTRKFLEKENPIGLLSRAQQEPESSLSQVYLQAAMKKFPSKPQFLKLSTYYANKHLKPGSGIMDYHRVRDAWANMTAEDKKKLEAEMHEEGRQQYYEAFNAMRAIIEKHSKNPSGALSVLGDRVPAGEPDEQQLAALARVVRNEVNEAHATMYRDHDKGSVGVAALKKMWAGLKPYAKSSPASQLKDFRKRAAEKWEDSDERDSGSLEAAKKMLEGKSMNAAFDQIKKRSDGDVNLHDMYNTDVMRRKGPSSQYKNSDAAVESLRKASGMRAVIWGKSLPDDEREHHLKSCLDSFHDLTDILGLPREMASFNGKLAIGIAADGRAGALAHYAHDKKFINLTRNGGAGALAHEWGHFFDFTLNTLHGEKNLPLSQTAKGDHGDHPVHKAMADLMDSDGYRMFHHRLTKTDGAMMGRGFTTAKWKYWTSKHEMFARSFERYVQRKLAKSGRENTYLSGIMPQAHNDETGLWPTDKEVEAMAPHFDALFEAFKKSDLLKKAIAYLQGQTFELPLLKADKLPGGRADKRRPSDFDSEALAEGARHELEHTNDGVIAREIAMDHLAEDPDYYRKLRGLKKASNGAAPGPSYEQSPLPDYEFIYNTPSSRQNEERENEATANRRRAVAAENKGKFGFHGENPEPQLRYEEGDYPKQERDARNLKQKKPQVKAPKMLLGKMRKKKRKPNKLVYIE